MVKQGSIIKLHTGHRQKDKRTVLVISNDTFNTFCKMSIVCPIAETQQQHPFHLPLNGQTQTTGCILCEQVRTVEILARNAEFVETVPDETLAKAMQLITSFMTVTDA